MKKSTCNLQDAISDLAALRPNWTLLADTFPAEFLRQVKGEIESLAAEPKIDKLAAERDAQREELGVSSEACDKAVEMMSKAMTNASKAQAEATLLREELAALKKRVADAEKIYTPDGGRAALVRLEDGE